MLIRIAHSDLQPAEPGRILDYGRKQTATISLLRCSRTTFSPGHCDTCMATRRGVMIMKLDAVVASRASRASRAPGRRPSLRAFAEVTVQAFRRDGTLRYDAYLHHNVVLKCNL